MDRFKAEAESDFLNFSGEELDQFAGDDENYAGEDDNYGGDEEYFSGAGLDRINPNDKTLSFTIENNRTDAADPNKLEAVLFGGYKNLYETNMGNPTGVAVSLGESNYKQFVAETLSSPVLIKGLRYFVKSQLQFANTLEMIEETATGTTHSMKYQPATKVDGRSMRTDMLDDRSFQLTISGRHYLKVPINKGEIVTLVMTIATRVDQAKTLEGKSILEVARPKIGARRARR
jgi:hypothetical protein